MQDEQTRAPAAGRQLGNDPGGPKGRPSGQRDALGRFVPVDAVADLARRLRLSQLDHRRSDVQDFLATRDQLSEALGGAEELSPQETALVGEAAFKQAVCRAAQRVILAGGARRREMLDRYLAWSDSLQRTLVVLGLKKRAQRINLREYVSGSDRDEEA